MIYQGKNALTGGFKGWFFSDPKYHGDPIAYMLLTAPTIGVCLYSVGIVVARRWEDATPGA